MAELVFSRETGQEAPQYVPPEGHKAQPVGSADEQAAEAMRVAKERNKREAAHEEKFGLLERIAKMDSMLANQAVEFLRDQPQAEREKYLEAEKRSKNRKTVKAYFGVA